MVFCYERPFDDRFVVGSTDENGDGLHLDQTKREPCGILRPSVAAVSQPIHQPDATWWFRGSLFFGCRFVNPFTRYVDFEASSGCATSDRL